jgi:prolyl-tRNA synthetase
MRYSKFFGKTSKENLKDVTFKSHELLIKGGYIRESVAGRYFFLPLGMRVRNKLVEVVRDEMNKTGAQEMIAPVLHPIELWQETNRTNAAGFELTKVTDRRGAQFALGGTAEEMFVDLVRKFQISYKELPFNLYQFSPKFRDELRARGGLLRVREFLMKDAYSFDRDEVEFRKQYQVMWDTYIKIYERLGLNAVAVESDGGYIGGDYCHEFVVENEIGESGYLETEDGSYRAHEDVAKFVYEDVNPQEEVREFEIIDQPEWVQTMEENVRHYGKDSKFFLKNVVYKNFEGDVIIAVLRGDMEANTVKLQRLLGEEVELVAASDDDLKAIGTKSGYVHAWGHEFVEPRKSRSGDRDCRVIYVADDSLKTVRNFIGGQKEEKTDSANVNYGRDFKHEIEGDVAVAREGFLGPDGKSRLVSKRGVEVGNIFQLGYHYTKRMSGAVFADADGGEKPFYMGCYGIGIGRTLQTVAENYGSDKGIAWPEEIAPFAVELISIGKDEEVQEQALAVYMQLVSAGVEVLFDDRKDVSPGAKFADADLIGAPVRLVVSARTEGKVEFKRRDEDGSEVVAVEEVVGLLAQTSSRTS